MGILDWTGSPRYFGRVGIGALAAGGAARLLKNLYDVGTSEKGERVRIKSLRPAVSDVTVEVSPEEADELRRQGIMVKKVMRKKADSPYGPNPWFSAGYGALGAAGAVGGWKLTDMIIDKLRKARAKKEIKKVRRRIEDLLEGQPAVGSDQVVLESMKTAEDAHIEKKAAILSGLGMAAGASAVLQALASFKKGRREDIPTAKIQAIRSVLNRRAAGVPMAAMRPVVYMGDRRKKIEEEEEESEAPAIQEELKVAPPPAAPVPAPVEVVEATGSPADSADKPKKKKKKPAATGSWI